MEINIKTLQKIQLILWFIFVSCGIAGLILSFSMPLWGFMFAMTSICLLIVWVGIGTLTKTLYPIDIKVIRGD